MLSETSATSSRSEYLEFFKEQYGLDDANARLLLRAERLQEKGQVDQSLAYFQQVLTAYPNCHQWRKWTNFREVQTMVTGTRSKKVKRKQMKKHTRNVNSKQMWNPKLMITPNLLKEIQTDICSCYDTRAMLRLSSILALRV